MAVLQLALGLAYPAFVFLALGMASPRQVALGVLLLGLLSGCGADKETLSADGFVLPQGNVDRGQQVKNNAVAIGVLLGGALVVAFGLWGLTVGSLAAFLLVMQTTYRPVKEMSRGWAQLMDAIPSAERFLELLDAEDGVAPRHPNEPVRTRRRRRRHDLDEDRVDAVDLEHLVAVAQPVLVGLPPQGQSVEGRAVRRRLQRLRIL